MCLPTLRQLNNFFVAVVYFELFAKANNLNMNTKNEYFTTINYFS